MVTCITDSWIHQILGVAGCC